MLLRLFALARAPMEHAEAEVAVGNERAPAELGGERHRLTVVGLGGLNLLVCIERQRNGAENVKHIRFRASLLLSLSEIKGALGTFAGLGDPSGRQVGLAEPSEAERTGHKVAVGFALFKCLSQQGQRLVHPPGEAIGLPQALADPLGKASPDLPDMRNLETPFEKGDDAIDVTFPLVQLAEARVCLKQTGGLIARRRELK